MKDLALKSIRASRFVFALLAAYILFQFVWWAYHIVELHGVIRDMELAKSSGTLTEAINQSYSNKVKMIIGEGFVFAGLLIFGIWRLNASLRKEADLARQERNFMLAVTHELKTPVATLRLFLETLHTRKQLPEEKKTSILSDALNETERLDHLIENILLSTRLELNDDQVHKESVDVTALVRKVSEKLHRAIGGLHRLNIQVHDDVVLSADPNMIESLLSNLFDNAVKYSPEGSLISVFLTKTATGVTLAVEDEGSGIPAEERERIFRKFYRIGNEDTRKTKGTGLGLHLVSRIAALHGGEVLVKDGKQKGARFEVFFPQKQL